MDDRSLPVPRASGWREDEKIIDGHVWINLLVETPHGYVDTHSNTKFGGGTSLNFIYRGRRYSRYIKQFYRPRYLVTLASRFVDDVVARTGQKENES